MEQLTKKTIGQQINAALASKDVKQKELAKHLGVPDNTISYFVSGRRVPNTEQIIKIAQFLNVSTDFLLGLTDVQGTDTEIKAICEYTGLSEKAAKKLNYYSKNDLSWQRLTSSGKEIHKDFSREFLNYLIEHSSELSYSVSAYKTALIISTEKLTSKISFMEQGEIKNTKFEIADEIDRVSLLHNEINKTVHYSEFISIETFKKLLEDYLSIELNEHKINIDRYGIATCEYVHRMVETNADNNQTE